MNPALVPAEAIVESESREWWTAGRRIRIGALAAEGLVPVDEAAPELLLKDLPAPYDHLDGQGYDGLELYLRRDEEALNLAPALFADVPQNERADLWDPSELAYSATFAAGDQFLAVPRHLCGHLDWYSVDADGQLSVDDEPDWENVYPTRVRYPGAPHPRWWQIEEAHFDIGGFPPDRSHLATMLLIDLISSHSDDWFLFPVTTMAGSVVLLREVLVLDAFDDTWEVTPPPDWSIFAVTGLQPTALPAWATVTTPLVGPLLEDVLLGIDEDANLLWAVERRLGGRDVPTAEHPSPDVAGEKGEPTPAAVEKSYAYRPSTTVFPHWHPYSIQSVNGRRRFMQGRLADLNKTPPELMSEPRARLLSDPMRQPGDPPHQIEPATVSSAGMRLERRRLLERRTDGAPVLWMQRIREPLRGHPGLELRFDVLEETLAGSSAPA